MNFNEFIETLSQNEVDYLWDKTRVVPAEAVKNTWKYFLKKEDKIIPFKWFLIELAKTKNVNIDFGSSYDNRDIFCDKYGFEIFEELVFDNTEKNKFISFYNQNVNNKKLFQYFIEIANTAIKENNINPYKIRMALTHSNEAMIIIGMRAVLSYKNDKIGFIIKSKKYPELKELYNLEKDYDFKGGNESSYVYSQQNFTPDNTIQTLLEVNYETIWDEYYKIVNQKSSRWNSEAKTTNSVLKYIIFNNENVENFIKTNKTFEMEYFDIGGIKRYKELMMEPYSTNSDATRIFNDTRTKLYYLAELLSKEIGEELIVNYTEKPNKQAGRGATHLNYKDYIIVGFLPERYKYLGKDIFLKASFGFWESDIMFHYQFDVNYKDNNNLYNEDRDFLNELNPVYFNLETEFPNNWKDLLDTSLPLVKNLIIALDEYMNAKKIREEFANWLIIKPSPNYYENNKNKLISKLNQFNTFFDFDIFDCTEENYLDVISKLRKIIYSDENNEFLSFSESEQHHVPKGILGKENYFKFLEEKFNSSHTNLKYQMEPFEPYPLNQILFGAPGTGKTYNTKKIAVEIIENRTFSDSKEDRRVINGLYKKYTDNKQIRFTTFHQSLSYEDFIEGIKPKLGDANKEIEYEVRDGIFKLLCKDATQLKQSNNFEEAYTKFIEEVFDAGKIELKSLAKKTPFDVKVNSNQNCVAIPHTETATNMVITKKMIEEYIINGNSIDWKTYTSSIGEYIKSKYQISVSNSDNQNKKYVLIMDEINRGNVSSIFGELITLLEEDKRKGGKEELEVELPYSQKKFSVPSNVYLVGTMNTADRSVEALDTALRRRFSFTEMKANPEVLKDPNYNEVNLRLLLQIINERIELLIDKDHQIGHSYLIEINNLDDLKNIFKNKIIPLLEEYFYGDFGKIGLVLGENFIEIKNKTQSETRSVLASFSSYEDIDFIADKKIYCIKDISKFGTKEFQSIYQNPLTNNE